MGRRTDTTAPITGQLTTVAITARRRFAPMATTRITHMTVRPTATTGQIGSSAECSLERARGSAASAAGSSTEMTFSEGEDLEDAISTADLEAGLADEGSPGAADSDLVAALADAADLHPAEGSAADLLEAASMEPADFMEAAGFTVAEASTVEAVFMVAADMAAVTGN